MDALLHAEIDVDMAKRLAAERRQMYADYEARLRLERLRRIEAQAEARQLHRSFMVGPLPPRERNRKAGRTPKPVPSAPATVPAVVVPLVVRAPEPRVLKIVASNEVAKTNTPSPPATKPKTAGFSMLAMRGPDPRAEAHRAQTRDSQRGRVAGIWDA